ncbi:MAG: LysR family transcriptional regulator [Rhodobacteraceae bacterium]|nr:LysR family transcriptional regulator [Paracoccaceae bacterium]
MTDIRMLDPQLLLVFEALIDTHSATLSAARLNLSQSAVSGALKRLRQIFDDPLFERHSHGLTPTQRAEDLSTQISEVLLGLRALASPHAFDPASATGTVTILATDFAIATLLAPFRARLAQEAPGLKTAFQPFSGADVASVRNLNTVDFVIGSLGMLPESYSATALRSDPLMLFMSQEHPLAQSAVSVQDMIRFPHILVILRGNTKSTMLDDLLEQQGMARMVTTLCYSFLTLPILLEDHHSLAIAPKSLANVTAGNLIAKPSPIPLPDVKLFAAWHHRAKNDPQNIWMRNILRTCAS